MIAVIHIILDPILAFAILTLGYIACHELKERIDNWRDRRRKRKDK